MRVPTAADAGDLSHLSDEPRRHTDWSLFAGLSLTRTDTEARSVVKQPMADPGAEERALAKFDRDAEGLRTRTAGRVCKTGER